MLIPCCGDLLNFRYLYVSVFSYRDIGTKEKVYAYIVHGVYW